MAFQLVDDVLDFTAREKTLGKPVGSDLREGKVTLPLVYALECATPEERALVETILRAAELRRGAVLPAFWRCSKSTAASSACRNAPRRSPTRPAASSANFRSRRYQRALLAVTELVTERDH